MCNAHEKYKCHLSIGAWLEPKVLNMFGAKFYHYELEEDNSKLAYRCIYLFILLGDLIGSIFCLQKIFTLISVFDYWSAILEKTSIPL